MSNRKRRRLICRIALGLAAAAVAAPSAQARLDEGIAGRPVTTPTAVLASESPDGFDWGDAGTGAGVAVGAVLLALGAARAGIVRRGKLAGA